MPDLKTPDPTDVIRGRFESAFVNHPVLVPVDFSSCSRAALAYAANYARQLGSPLVVLHVIHEPLGEPGFYRRNGKPGTLRPIEDLARGVLREFVNEVCDDDLPRKPRLVLVDGLPAGRIREIAEREHAGLIVMGTHGHVGLARLAMGSVAAEVTHHSSVPVTIVKAPLPGREEPAVDASVSAG